MKKAALAFSFLMMCAAAAAPAQAGLFKKAAKLAVVVGAGAAVAAKAKATNGATPKPAQPEPAPHSATTAPVLTTGATQTPAKPDANAVIDKGAAKAKTATAAVKGWFAKKKAEFEAKRVEQVQPVGPTAPSPVGGRAIPSH